MTRLLLPGLHPRYPQRIELKGKLMKRKQQHEVCIRTVSGHIACGPVVRTGRKNPPENPQEPEVSIASAHKLAEIINSQQGAPQARVWIPSKAGYAPRVYVGNVGYFTLHRYDVVGHDPSSRTSYSGITLRLTSLYPSQRRAMKAALDQYRTTYAIPKSEAELRAAMQDYEQEAAMLNALRSGAKTWGEIRQATGFSLQEAGSVMRRLRAKGLLE